MEVMISIGSSKPTSPRRWLTYAGLLALAVLAWPAWRACDSWWRGRNGFQLINDGNFAAAADYLDKASAAYPRDKELAFLAAVAHRRKGDLHQFEIALRRAEELGSPPKDIRLQKVLARTQHGLGDADTEDELNQLCTQGAGDFEAEQIYEARAKGYMSVYQVTEALQALAYWIQWKPKAVAPRLLRAQLYEQIDSTRYAEEDYQAIVEAEPKNVEARIRFAQFLLLAQKQDEALVEFETCAKLAPRDPRVLLGMSDIQLRTGGNLAEVERTLRELIAGKPDPDVYQYALMLLANIHLNRKEYDKVVSLLEEVTAAEDLDIPTYQSLIRAYSALNRRDKAQHYRDILEKKLKQRDEINRLYEQIIRKPSDPSLRYRMGNIFWEKGNKEVAVTWWYTAVLAEPLHQPSHEALAEYFVMKGDLGRAAKHQASAEKSVERTFRLAWSDYSNDDLVAVRNKIPAIAKYPAYKPYAELLECALEVNEKQGRLDPNRLEALRRLVEYPHLRNYALAVLGAGMFQLGRFGEAEEALLEVIRNDPRSIEAHRWLAAMNFDIRVLDRLYYHCDQWAKLDPYDYRPHRLMGLQSKSRQAFAQAIEAYQESLRRNPNQPTKQEVLVELAECQYRSGKADVAIETLDKAAPSVERDVLYAQCLLAVQRNDESKQLLTDILERDPKNMMANMLGADIAVQENEFETARIRLEAVTANFPSNHSGWFKLSQVYTKLDAPDKARQASKKAEQLRAVETEFFTVMERAIALPEDVGVRQQLSALARQLGRNDLAEEWDRAADLLKNKQMSHERAAAKPPTTPGPAPILLETSPAYSRAESKAVPQVVPNRTPSVVEAAGTESAVQAEEDRQLFSGPQKGERLGNFALTNAFGDEEGKEIDPVARAGDKPLLLVFVHEVNRPSVAMARLLGDYAAGRAKDELHCGVVFLTDNVTETEAWMKRAVGALPKDVPLGISKDGKEGPGEYGLNRKVTMTILMAKEGKVTANFALVQPSIKEDAPKILQAIVDVVGGKGPTLEELGYGAAAPQRPQPRKAEKQDK